MSLDVVVFFFKQKTAYEMRISDWSSDVCSSDLVLGVNSRIFYLGVRKFIYGVDTPENVDAWVEMEIILFLDGVVNIYPGLVAPPPRRVRKPRLARATKKRPPPLAVASIACTPQNSLLSNTLTARPPPHYIGRASSTAQVGHYV